MNNGYSLIIILGICIFPACNLADYQIDPNRTTEATPGLILTDLIVNSFNIVDASPMLASRMLVYTDGLDLSQYYGWNRSGFGAYDQLRQTKKMIEEAERVQQPNYIALAKFFRAYSSYGLTMTFGDVPYSQAIQGFDNNFQPIYDTQEDVFKGILLDLEEANADLDEDQATLLGDVLYEGDVVKWKKAINSFRLRVLMTLSAKEGNSSIDIKNQFTTIISDPTTYPLISGNDENLALPYHDVAGNRYPFFENQNLTSAYLMEKTFVDLMKEREDPRLFAVGSITPNAQAEGLASTNFDAYGGLDGSAFFDALNIEKASGVGSLVNDRYHTNPTVEPSVIMGHAELQFILAEASVIGWIASDPQVFYNQAIRSNMEFYGVSSAKIDEYLSHSLVSFDPAVAMEQINTQKYLTYFFSGGWESFYNQRRTGYPVFSADGGTLNEGKVPVRWMYPESESNLNKTNLEAALQRQYGGQDNVNGNMWLLN
ncbi:MAG: SusD/RagB family nutrient-binding outer membrane lipoprotein [Bacteroidota bacterium]